MKVIVARMATMVMLGLGVVIFGTAEGSLLSTSVALAALWVGSVGVGSVWNGTSLSKFIGGIAFLAAQIGAMIVNTDWCLAECSMLVDLLILCVTIAGLFMGGSVANKLDKGETLESQNEH